MITTTNDANLRMAARRRNLLLEKRRGGCRPAVSNGYMIRDAFNDSIIAGEKYQLSAEDVRNFLNEFDKGM